MATSPLLRWGITLSVALIAIAFAFRLQQPLLGATDGEAATYCYKHVRTHDNENPSAQCFSVSGGSFQHVGTEDELNSDSPPVVASDGYVIPGLWDGHGHLLQYGEFLHSVDLFGSKSLDEVRERLTAYLDANPGAGTKNQWVRGVGWDQTNFGRMPTAVSSS